MTTTIQGAGLGLRRAMLDDVEAIAAGQPDFLELAPENWIDVGGRFGKRLRALAERFPLICHGLSLSLGGPQPLDEVFLAKLRKFLDEHQVSLYSEHLSYCADHGHLYDLMPIPFTRQAVDHVAARISRAQDALKRRIAVENVSYYVPLASEMAEIDFILAVLDKADCDLLLDVNNVYVNSVNHGYDPEDFMARLPPSRVRYLHVAGHYREAEDLIVDTHGAAVVPRVWELLRSAYRYVGALPTLLERDFNFPPMPELLAEVAAIRDFQSAAIKAPALPRVSYA